MKGKLMDTNAPPKIDSDGKPLDPREDTTVEMREAFRNALAAWRSSIASPQSPNRPAQSARPFRPGTVPTAVRPRAKSPSPPPRVPETAPSGRPFAIRVLTWIAFLAIVVLLFRLID